MSQRISSNDLGAVLYHVSGEDQENGLGDSWVAFDMEADVERRSSAMKEMERLLHEAQRESGSSSLAGSSKAGSSPPATPCNSVRSTPGQSGQASPKNPGSNEPPNDPEVLTQGLVNTDWVWDWSSTPETRPPKNTQFKRPARRTSSLSMRKSSAMKAGYFSREFLQVFIPSIIITNLLAFGFGIYIGKRLSANKTA